MKIKKNDELKQVFAPQDVRNYGEAKVSLFVVSETQSRLKKLNLEGLRSEERAAKLRKWAEGHRFVAVIEMGDQVFAHANAKFVERLEQQQDLSINGKKVSVSILTDDESHLLDAVGEACAQTAEENEKDHRAATETEASSSNTRSPLRQFFANSALLSDEMLINHWVARIENIPSKVILDVLRIMSEARREEERVHEERKKQDDILRTEINRQILKGEIVKGEIKHQELKIRQTAQSTIQARLTRGQDL